LATCHSERSLHILRQISRFSNGCSKMLSKLGKHHSCAPSTKGWTEYNAASSALLAKRTACLPNNQMHTAGLLCNSTVNKSRTHARAAAAFCSCTKLPECSIGQVMGAAWRIKSG